MSPAMRYCPSCGARFTQDATFCPHDGSQTQELPEAPTGDPLIGMLVDGRYQVESQLGEGGMGIVYLATHKVLGKKLALKVLRGEMARDADVVQRFVQEAQTASSIGHPNIVDIHDFGRLPDGAVYFVMEYLDGEGLSDMIARGGSIPMQEAILIIQQIASALGAAHARGVVHRDLKPDNVFILRRGGDPVVKVLDFGIAKVGGAGAKITRTGMVFGTPHYMSPEQAAGQSVDGRTDIYALGVIMYEMFTGKVPFDADTFMGILSKHMFESPIRPSELGGAHQLGAVEDIILKALAKKAEDRHQDMDAVMADLMAVKAGGEVAVGGRPGVGVPAGLANSLEPPSRTEMRLATMGALPQNRGPLILVGGVALVVVALGVVGVVFALRGGEGDDADASDEVATLGAEGAEGTSQASGEQGELAGTGLPEGKAPPEEPAHVEVTGDPLGAKVFLDGALVGNAPVKLPRPAAGSERHLVVRQRGYLDGQVILTAASPDTVSFELEPVPKKRTAQQRPRRAPRPARATSEPKPEPKPEAQPKPKRSPLPSITQEVVDPWAD
jgi:eukaryotic-like serine/threonine-protein kinase